MSSRRAYMEWIVRGWTSLAILLMWPGWVAAQAPAPILSPPAPSAKVQPPTPMSGVKSWAYQLQKADPLEIARSPFDLVVIDYSRNGTDSGRFTREEIAAMQKKPDGGRRLVIAYLSIGEAEDYRFYWDKKWVEAAPLRLSSVPNTAELPRPSAQAPPQTVRIPRLVAPGWLGRENERWHGNYLIRFWYEGWQDILIYNSDSYLARIQQAGFDGAYLDRVDAYYAMESDRADAARRMIDLVSDLATVARRRQPGFLLIAQNAEELLREPKYLSLINGIAKEDLLYGSPTEGAPNETARVTQSTNHLMVARAAGLPVLAIEYLDRPEDTRAAEAALRSRTFLPYFGPRKLDRLIAPLPLVAAPQ